MTRTLLAVWINRTPVSPVHHHAEITGFERLILRLLGVLR